MAETLVENQVCSACGADVRPNALFCYHCGAAVAEDASAGSRKKASELPGDINFREKMTDADEDSFAQPEEIKSEKSKTARERLAVREKSKNNGREGVKLRSAAALRNKAKKLEPKKVEIIWEEHENAPNAWFIGVAVLLVIFTVLVYFIAMYLK